MYEKYFGFAERPFNVTPDPRFFFANDGYRAAYATLCYGVEARKGFIVVTGEAGTGKTTLLRKFMQNCGPNTHPAYIINSRINFTEFLTLTMNDLELTIDTADRAAMTENFSEYLIQQLQQNHLVCLLIDEAQNLSKQMLEEIRMLSNLETDREKLLQIVLMGQPEFDRRLNEPKLAQLKQRIALRCKIQPLTPQEVGPYIYERLVTAGYQGRDLFSAEAIEGIVSCSNGIPRLINVVCDNALLNAFATSRRRISADIVEEVAQELKLVPAARPMEASTSLGDFKKALGEDLFQPTRKTIPPEEVVAPRSEFDYVIQGMNVPPIGLRIEKGQRRWLRRASILALVLATTGTVASLYSQKIDLSVVRDHLGRITATGREYRPLLAPIPPPQSDTRKLAEAPSTEPVPAAEPVTRPQEPLIEEELTPLANSANTAVKQLRPTVLESRSKQAPAKIQETRRPAAELSSARRQPNDEDVESRLKADVLRAIQIRAISGVDIQVRDGTVYLHGRVASLRQKRAALRATLGVAGVNEVRDRISVGWTGRGGRN